MPKLLPAALLQRTIIALVLVDTQVVLFQLNVGPLRVLTNPYPNRAVLVFKILPILLQHFGRKDVVANVSILVLSKEHKHVHGTIWESELPFACGILAGGMNANFSRF